jgi:LCP family protein required for cell wall assembly
MDNRKLVARVLVGLGIVVGIAVGVTFGLASRIVHRAKGEQTGGSATGLVATIKDITQIVTNPYGGFPGQNKVTILCMGIDDNWTDSDEVYTRNARTDTLFLLTLDLQNHKATMLSIPRDTYAHIVGTNWNFKINAAYETGGPQRAVDTVDEVTGVRADHYMVLNIDATKKMVDALGGVDVDVEHAMHYHDKWGHLSIDLTPGFQHLSGDQAVGFARYRHGDAHTKGSPEDGDERRMYRQHVLMRAMIAKGKSLVNATQAPHLIDVAMSAIRTDLTRTQLMDLAVIYRGMQPDDMLTASLPGEDFRGPKGEWFYRLYPEPMKAYVGWLVRGDETATRALAPIVVKNGTQMPRLAAHAAYVLEQAGYTNVRVSGSELRPRVGLASMETRPAVAVTQLLDTGVPDKDSVKDVVSNLGVQDAVARRIPNKPNHLGWTAPSAITIVLGQDYAQAVQAAGGIAPTESYTPPSQAQVNSTYSSGDNTVDTAPAPSDGATAPDSQPAAPAAPPAQ